MQKGPVAGPRPMPQTTPSAQPSGGGGGGSKQQLKGKSYADGAAMLAPGGGLGQGLVPDPKNIRPTPMLSQEEAKKRGYFNVKARHLDDGFSQIGGMLEQLAPTVGSGFEGAFEIDQFNAGYKSSLAIEGAVRRTPAGFEVEAKVKGLVGEGIGTKKAHAYVGVKAEVGVKAQGDSGRECLDLIGLSVLRQMEALKVPPAVIGCVFSAGYAGRVAAGMDEVGATGPGNVDEEDSVEWSGGIGIAGGVQTGGKSKGSGDVGGGLVTKSKYARPEGQKSAGRVAVTNGTTVFGSANYNDASGGDVSAELQCFTELHNTYSEFEGKLEVTVPQEKLAQLLAKWRTEIAVKRLPAAFAPMLPALTTVCLELNKAAAAQKHVGNVGIGVQFKVELRNGQFALKEIRSYTVAKSERDVGGGVGTVKGKATKDALVKKS